MLEHLAAVKTMDAVASTTTLVVSVAAAKSSTNAKVVAVAMTLKSHTKARRIALIRLSEIAEIVLAVFAASALTTLTAMVETYASLYQMPRIFGWSDA